MLKNRTDYVLVTAWETLEAWVREQMPGLIKAGPPQDVHHRPRLSLPSAPSVMSHIKRRIEALELDTCVVRGELPVDLGLDSVSGRLPGGDFGA